MVETGWAVLELDIDQQGKATESWKCHRFLKLQSRGQNRPEFKCAAYLNESGESIEAAAWQLQAQKRLLS